MKYLLQEIWALPGWLVFKLVCKIHNKQPAWPSLTAWTFNRSTQAREIDILIWVALITFAIGLFWTVELFRMIHK